jgi:beta-1,4-mannooligosaccharide/beta-1,4-mannosyl-N-acetylglucosamine phosphorylase
MKTKPCIRRCPQNPVLSPDQVPYACSLAFNAGVTFHGGRYIMVFRNDIADRPGGRVVDHNLGLAYSADGIHWDVEPEPINADDAHPLRHVSDPRLHVLDGRFFLTFSIGRRGVCGGLAVSDNLRDWKVLSISTPDNRNMVLFPERFDGKLLRLERPFAGYLRPGDRFDVWMSASPDGRYWGEEKLVITCDQLPWTNDKIGPGAPPLKTDQGWLALLHAVDRDDSGARAWGWEGNWAKRYTIGLALLDLEEPWKVTGYCREPLMVPELPYETEGYRPHVLFPTGNVLNADGEVKIFYGAADTVMALATCRVEDLLALCEPA